MAAKCNTHWIHVLLKGERSKNGDVEESQDSGYLEEFARQSLNALHVPILEFEYKNLDRLVLSPLAAPPTRIGLILTSPRALQWVRLALDYNRESCSGTGTRPVDTSFIDSKLVFVVGPKTAAECSAKLQMDCNTNSMESGNSEELTKVIVENCQSRDRDKIKLIYPKSSLAGETVESALASLPNITLEAFIAYQTTAIADMRETIVAKIGDYIMKQSEHKWTGAELGHSASSICENLELVVNLIFFSPSGVNGFCQLVDLDDLTKTLVTKYLKKKPVELTMRNSCIGKTTELALRQHNLDVYCVSSKPNAQVLVEELVVLSKCQL
uniref:Uroporphyrinogen-III synthase n=1 Tax=Aceria tosichella TaxID=561515 RepID=A0A6G1SMT1_9ACAR